MTSIRLENLVKRFGDFTALKTMDLDIRDGEFMALLGPSGCGKSTTMNMIAGMEEPTGGRILFDGRDMNGVPMGRRGVGFVFQNYAIFTHMTVRQNLAYGPKMRGMSRSEIDRRVAHIAELLQLTPMLDQKSAKLSVNILQRLAIGRSAIGAGDLSARRAAVECRRRVPRRDADGAEASAAAVQADDGLCHP
jgi:multiple sugar transport system ATP-binding protein